jgi:hypothetical protein
MVRRPNKRSEFRTRTLKKSSSILQQPCSARLSSSFGEQEVHEIRASHGPPESMGPGPQGAGSGTRATSLWAADLTKNTPWPKLMRPALKGVVLCATSKGMRGQGINNQPS